VSVLGIAFGGLLAALSSISPVQAHVKWLEPFDITTQPKPIGEVLSPTFIHFFLASVAVVYLFFLVDRIAVRRGVMRALDER